MTETTMQKVKRVNALLEAGEPYNISAENRSNGQSYTGYKPQSIIDAMNEVFEIGGWGFEEISSEIAEVQTAKGTSNRAVAQVRVWLKDVPFQPTGWGQANVTLGDIGDARKGAQTDAIKKAFSYFSIGNRAYQGLLPNPKDNNNQNRATQQPRPAQPTKPVSSIETKKPEENKIIPAQFTKLEDYPAISGLKEEATKYKLRWNALLKRVGCEGLADDAITPRKAGEIANIINAYKAKNGGDVQKAS